MYPEPTTSHQAKLPEVDNEQVYYVLNTNDVNIQRVC